MNCTPRLFFFCLFVATSTTSFRGLLAQEIEPVSLLAAGDKVPTGLSIIYDPESGRVSAIAPANKEFTALQLLSQSGSFTEQCQGVSGDFDVCGPGEVFKLETNGFSTVEFGPILQTHLDGESLLMDLLVNGASVGGGFDVGDGPYLVHADFLIPEPTSGFILGCGLLGLVVALRGRMQSTAMHTSVAR